MWCNIAFFTDIDINNLYKESGKNTNKTSLKFEMLNKMMN